MKTSWTETQQLEAYLFQEPDADATVLEARLILEPALLEKLRWQKKTYALVQAYGRKKLKEELETIHQKLFREAEHESFRQKILRIFSKL